VTITKNEFLSPSKEIFYEKIIPSTNKFLAKRPLDSVFQFVSRLFSQCDFQSDFVKISILFQICLDHIYATGDLSAVKCAQEIALKMMDNGLWIRDYSNQIVTILKKYIGQSIGAEFLNLISILTINPKSLAYLIDNGLFEVLNSKSLPCRTCLLSPLWNPLFTVMSMTDPRIVNKFIEINIHDIAFFLNDDEHPLENIADYKTLHALTLMLCRASSSISELNLVLFLILFLQ